MLTEIIRNTGLMAHRRREIPYQGPIFSHFSSDPYYDIYIYYYYWYSALGPVWAETRAQSGDWYGPGTLHS